MTAYSDKALRILTRIKAPHDVAGLSMEDKLLLADEIRRRSAAAVASSSAASVRPLQKLSRAVFSSR